MLILQLERFGRLSSEEKLALSSTSLQPQRLPAGLELPLEDGSADKANILLAGFACRYAVLPSGRRQILAYLLPGDLYDGCSGELFFSDHSIATLSAVEIGSYSREELASLGRRFPRIARGVALAVATEQATLRQWLLSVGHRSALERTAHLLCEIFIRVRSLGLVYDGICPVPLRQVDLADALAISAMHLNRTLGQIRRLRLAKFLHHKLVIQNFHALADLAGFQANYLFAGADASSDPAPVYAFRPHAMEAPLENDIPAAPPRELSRR